MTSLANIDISEIKDAGKRLDVSGRIDPEELRDADLLIKEPIAFRMRLEGKGYDVLELSGWLQARVRLQCCRCLEWFDYPLERDFRVDYSPVTESTVRERGEEREITGDDLYVSNYTGNVLNILEEYCAQLILSLPMSPHCHNECKGLCPQCGQNLNVKECDCTSGGDSLTGLTGRTCLTSLNFKEEKDA